MSFDTEAVALAARFAAAAMTPPAGYRAIASSTANLPNQIGKLPCVLVFLDSGSFEHMPGKRDSDHEWLVRFYYSQAGASDLDRDNVALRKWLDVLNYQLRASTQLGGIVTSAYIMTFRIGILDYAGQQYTGIEFGVTTNVNEGWAAVA